MQQGGLSQFSFFDWVQIVKSLPFHQLPGLQSQLKMAPAIREAEIRTMGLHKNPKIGSVLILIFPDSKGIAHIALIQRPKNGGIHSGQISFPGGRVENSDADYCSAALRETHEEIGIAPQNVEVIGQLTDLYIPPSNFLVKSFLGISYTTPEFVPHPAEVDQCLMVQLNQFFDRNNISPTHIALPGGYTLSTPCYAIDNLTIWGATAMIISEFVDLASQSIMHCHALHSAMQR